MFIVPEVNYLMELDPTHCWGGYGVKVDNGEHQTDDEEANSARTINSH